MFANARPAGIAKQITFAVVDCFKGGEITPVETVYAWQRR
jgi:hypothetical protein